MTPKALKLAVVRQRYNPYGGAERFVERALAALAGQGAEITLITRNWDGAPREGFRQLTCDPPYSRLFGGRTARDKSFCAAVQKEIAGAPYDIVQSHERIPGCTIFRAGDGVHAAWLAHRSRSLGRLQRAAQKLSPFHRHILASEAAMFAHPALQAVICNSRMVAEEIAHCYGVPESKLQVIYNGVDTAAFHPRLATEYRARLRAEQGIPENVPLLLFVGSGFQRKGVPQLLQAFSTMARQDARLIVVGADRHLKTLERQASRRGLAERIRFVGPQKDVRPWYGAADGFVLPTLYDPCPNAALEALACGLPILTSTTCGAREWVREEENGYVVDALDPHALSQRLDALCALSGSGEARAAARTAVEHLTLPAMAEQLLALYRKIGNPS